MRNVSDKSCRGNQNTSFVFNNFSFRESCRLCDNVEKLCRAGQTTYGNIIRRMRIACWITRATHTHTHTICNTCFSSATMVARTAPPCCALRTLSVLFVSPYCSYENCRPNVTIQITDRYKRGTLYFITNSSFRKQFHIAVLHVKWSVFYVIRQYFVQLVSVRRYISA